MEWLNEEDAVREGSVLHQGTWQKQNYGGKENTCGYGELQIVWYSRNMKSAEKTVER